MYTRKKRLTVYIWLGYMLIQCVCGLPELIRIELLKMADNSNQLRDTRPSLETDYTLCLICQTGGGELIKKPKVTSLEHLLECIHSRGLYGDKDYRTSSSRLNEVDCRKLLDLHVSYHRKCYKETVNPNDISRAKKRYEQAVSQNSSDSLEAKVGRPSRFSATEPDHHDVEGVCRPTRSLFEQFNSQLCFFCQSVNTSIPLHELSSFNAGKKLKDAVEASKNEKWKVQLSTAIDASDARSIDVKYHLPCWVKNVQRRSSIETYQSEPCSSDVPDCSKIIGEIEFISLAKSMLHQGSILSIGELCSAYQNILSANGVQDISCDRRLLKDLLQKHIPGVEFCKSAKRNESERVLMRISIEKKEVVNEALSESFENDMLTLLRSAKILRTMISKCEAWKFKGNFAACDDDDNNIPSSVKTFFRWVIKGPADTLQSEVRDTEVQKNVEAISQTIMYAFKTDRQVRHNPKAEVAPFRTRREWPLQLAVGLSVHHATRSKKLLNFLHGISQSVDYSRILQLETQLANAVVGKMKSDGVYIPSMMVKGTFIYFAIDNTDFNEDTPDGKRTLHGTATAIFQRKTVQSVEGLPITALDHVNNSALEPLPVIDVVPCIMDARNKPSCPTYEEFTPEKLTSFYDPYTLKDVVWLTSGVILRKSSSERSGQVFSNNIPTWAAYNSLIGSEKPLTVVGTPPLLPEPPHDWQILITVLKQAQDINAVVVGPERKTVISLDMQLYEKAKQIEMAKPHCQGKWVLRIGELHTVMTALRAIGTSIEDSGIEAAWISSDIYGPLTTTQILEGKHMKRSLTAHLITLQALFDLYWTEFEKQYPLESQCMDYPTRIASACQPSSTDDIKMAHEEFEMFLTERRVLDSMNEFNKSKETASKLFKFFHRYMLQVQTLLMFVRATRECNWELHLSALDSLCKYFFAHDRQKYSRMVPLYLSEMRALQTTDPEIWEEFSSGNFSVNKNRTPFCAIGADHGIEHINKWMKATGGLRGITLNPAARDRFFLTAPELARLSEEAQVMAGLTMKDGRKHHDLSPTTQQRNECNVTRLKATIQNSTNPMTYDGDDLPNIITNIVMPDDVAKEICARDEIGQAKYEEFVHQRINTNTVNIWSRMPKVKLKTWKSVRKEVKISVFNKVIQLKDERSLFSRLLIVARSRPEVDLKEAIGKYEFTALPGSMFNPDGSLAMCSDKSKLMEILENIGTQNTISRPPSTSTMTKRVAVLDGMAIVHSLGKSKCGKTCEDLAAAFVQILDNILLDYDEGHLIFDNYAIQRLSLKDMTRRKRVAGIQPVNFHIKDSTSIVNISMKHFLSSTKTKNELTVYLAQKSFTHFQRSSKSFIVTSQETVLSNKRRVDHLECTHEEADGRLILHAVDATVHGADVIDIFSQDTDVLVLAVRRIPKLCLNTNFRTGTGARRRVIPINPIFEALGEDKAAALPGFHSFTGADTTGHFVGKGKITCWKVFLKATNEIIEAFKLLGSPDASIEAVEEELEKYVCQLYDPRTMIKDVSLMRWHLFRKLQCEGQKLPPTKAALQQAILRAHYQAMIWKMDIVPKPLNLPRPSDYGWLLDDDRYRYSADTDTVLPPAPDAVIQLVRCGCKKNNCAARCSCRQNNLACTELCVCEAEEDTCTNIAKVIVDGIDDESDASDDEYSLTN